MRYVHKWPADVPLQFCQWRDAPDPVTTAGTISMAPYGGRGPQRAQVALSGEIANAAQAAAMAVWLADLDGGGALALLADFDRALYGYSPRYAESLARAGETPWRASNGMPQYWRSSTGDLLGWSAGARVVSGGSAGNRMIGLAGLYPGAVLGRGQKIRIGVRRHVIAFGDTVAADGTVQIRVAPHFCAAVPVGTPVTYPGDIGLFQPISWSVPNYDQDRRGGWSMTFRETYPEEQRETLTYV
ncbi:hypothetical protein FDP22_12615 [Paroceanicella profunda]|uniref:Uncharacterized protein n=1 Tax=Paroceanicella profunda TaxID=2579971 RepID=A0A5B8FYT0_9RHOB|nr:hypothetical protein [Paroceanicella profunda]QDL92550.1 hypothetical protein FDP22_12615 [Paroceanicella profunda]